MAYSYIPSTWESEAGGSPQVVLCKGKYIARSYPQRKEGKRGEITAENTLKSKERETSNIGYIWNP